MTFLPFFLSIPESILPQFFSTIPLTSRNINSNASSFSGVKMIPNAVAPSSASLPLSNAIESSVIGGLFLDEVFH